VELGTTTTTVSSSSNSNQLVQEKLVIPYLYLNRNSNNKSGAMKELLKHQRILQSLTSIKKQQQKQQQQSKKTVTPSPEVAKEHAADCASTLLRTIQLQVSLRLALWHWAGEALFTKQYLKSCIGSAKKSKKKIAKQEDDPSSSAVLLLLNDIVGLLQLAIVKISTDDAEVMQFLMTCIRQADCEALPAVTQQIWDYFEKPNPYLAPPQQPNESKDALDRILALDLSPTKKKKKRAVPAAAAKKENQEPNNKKQKKDENNSLLPFKVSLTAPTRRTNSLLLNGSARSNFVGSHFNSSLSNASSLFRQVPAVNKQQQQQPSNHHNKNKTTTRSKMAPPTNTVVSAATTQKATPGNDFLVPATPLHKSSRSGKQNRRSVVLETPVPPLRMHRSAAVVLETPQPPRDGGGGLALVRPRATSTLAAAAPPASSSNLVAEAFRALAVQKARRDERRRKSALLG